MSTQHAIKSLSKPQLIRLKRLADAGKVSTIERDPEFGDWIVELGKCWQLEGQGNEVAGAHTFGADNFSEIERTIRQQVVSCNCKECQP